MVCFICLSGHIYVKHNHFVRLNWSTSHIFNHLSRRRWETWNTQKPKCKQADLNAHCRLCRSAQFACTECTFFSSWCLLAASLLELLPLSDFSSLSDLFLEALFSYLWPASALCIFCLWREWFDLDLSQSCLLTWSWLFWVRLVLICVLTWPLTSWLWLISVCGEFWPLFVLCVFWLGLVSALLVFWLMCFGCSAYYTAIVSLQHSVYLVSDVITFLPENCN